MNTQHAPHHARQRRSRWVWWMFAAAAVFYLTVEHRAHLAGGVRYLPLLILLACPLLHVFMHGGHGGHGGHGSDGNSSATNAAESSRGSQGEY